VQAALSFASCIDDETSRLTPSPATALGEGVFILNQGNQYAKIDANSVVLQPVPDHATAAGVPARIISQSAEQKPAFEMNQYFEDIQGMDGEGI